MVMYVCRRKKDGKFRRPTKSSGNYYSRSVNDSDRWTDDLNKAKLYQSKTSNAYDGRTSANDYEWYEAHITTSAPTKEETQYWQF